MGRRSSALVCRRRREGERKNLNKEGRGLKRKRDCSRENGEQQNIVLAKERSAVSTPGQRAVLTATA